MPRPKGYPAPKKTSAHRHGKRYAICAELNPVIEAEAEKAGMSLGDWLATAVRRLAGISLTNETDAPDAAASKAIAEECDEHQEPTDEALAASLFEQFANEQGLPETVEEGEDWCDVAAKYGRGESLSDLLYEFANARLNEYYANRMAKAMQQVKSKWLTAQQKQKVAEWMSTAGATEEESINWYGFEEPESRYEKMSAKEIIQEIGDFFDASHLRMKREFSLIKQVVNNNLRESGSDLRVGFTTVARAVAELWQQTYVGVMRIEPDNEEIFNNRWLGFGEIPEDLTLVQQAVLAVIQERHSRCVEYSKS